MYTKYVIICMINLSNYILYTEEYNNKYNNENNENNETNESKS